jgi:hypothetical protein
MNHKDAMPANGTRLSVMVMVARRDESVSHTPALAGSEGAETVRK